MKILFIWPDITLESRGIHLGIGCVSSVLKGYDHHVSLLHITRWMSKKKFLSKIKKTKPDLIGFSSTTHQYPYVKIFSKWIKEEYETPIVCGGHHATLNPDEVLSHKNIDMICIGEGEYPMLELANNLESGQNIENIQNLWIKNGDTIIRNVVRPLISNLDELPFTDREIFNYKSMLRKRGGEAEFMAGRGCPYNCTYCCNHVLKRIYKEKGQYVRIRSVENVLNEIGEVADKYRVKKIKFHDDTFTLFPKWIKEFCEKYPMKFDLPFSCNARVETLNNDLLSRLRKAGCDQINIGIESGNRWLRRTVLKRGNVTNEQIVSAFGMAKEVGITTYSFNMVGIPFETPSMVEETIQLNKLASPDIVQVSIFYPYPNTELYDLCRKRGYLTNEHAPSYFVDYTILNLPTMTRDEVTDYYHNFRDLVFEKYIKFYYPRLSPLFRALKPLLRTKARKFLLKSAYHFVDVTRWLRG